MQHDYLEHQWQGISTAPVNKWVLLRGGWQKIRWSERGDIGPAVVARKDPHDGLWRVGDSDADFAASNTWIEYADPTHWMDIPEYDNATRLS